MGREEKHVVALSGGKDSAALAVYLKRKYPDLKFEYVFTDTGCELPETYEYLNRIRALLNIKITTISPQRDFDYWLKYYNGILPSIQSRWRTRHLKIEPYEKHLGNHLTYSYIAIRADEDRKGYYNTKGNILPIYPFVEDNISLQDIICILKESGLGLPKYYKWRKRSGCYFCFFQSDREWLELKKRYPKLFEKACNYEEQHADGREYTWRDKKGNQYQYLHNLTNTDVPMTPPPLNKPTVDKKLLTRLKGIEFINKFDKG